ncbi:hypothetical protein O181_005363 [Austropuccinia psidii MF-1]|uniref:Uncharacterized protein n=1 Tax=Austropuccinia psidii MF-1 TaxID=1389203 RepID=A0A9Q3BI43_9BASI|nr:hypothetical protein [Austropuccinia psidii MF-1]
MTSKEEMYKIHLINLIQDFQHEGRNSTRCNTSKINKIEQVLYILPGFCKPPKQSEGIRNYTPQVLDVENSQMKNEFSTSFHNLEPSMGQALFKEVPKLEEWHHFSANRWYIKLRQAHEHQSWTWWKTKIINKWANHSWRSKVETDFESEKLNSDNDRYLPWFFQQKDRMTALDPDMSEFMIHRKILRQCEGELEHDSKRRTIEQSSSEDIINLLE